MRQVAHPRRFLDRESLSPEAINENLRVAAAYLDDNRGQRYTYSEIRLPLAGVTNASAQVLREIAIRRPGAARNALVVGVELVVYGDAAGDTWTLSCSDTAFPPISLETAGAGTTESYVASDVPIPIPSSSSDVLFTLSCSTASTIVDGDLIVHLRCDRGDQGDDFAGYDPPAFTSATSTSAATLELEVFGGSAALDLAIAREVAADSDLRAEVYVVRNLGIGASRDFQLPPGEVRIFLRVDLYVVAAVGRNASVQVSGTLTLVTVTTNGAGATSRAVNGAGPGADTSVSGDPMTAANDTHVTISDASGGGTIDLAYAVVWWR